MDHRITQCPRCGTSFRVTEAHLAVAAGAVRCGSCLHIFNAREHWAEDRPAPAPEPAPTVDEPDLDDLIIDDDALFDDNTPLFAEERVRDEPLIDTAPPPSARAEPLFNEVDFSATADLDAAHDNFSLIDDAPEELTNSFSDLGNWEENTNTPFGRVQDLDEELSASDEEWTRDLLRDDEPLFATPTAIAAPTTIAAEASQAPPFIAAFNADNGAGNDEGNDEGNDADHLAPALEDYGLVAAEPAGTRREPTFGDPDLPDPAANPSADDLRFPDDDPLLAASPAPRFDEPAPMAAALDTREIDLNPEFIDIPPAHRAGAPEHTDDDTDDHTTGRASAPIEGIDAESGEPETIVTDASYALPTPATPAPETDPLASLHRLATEPLQIHRFKHEPRWPGVLWGLAVVALLLLLAGQYAYKNFDTLARGPARPWLAQACSLAGCNLPPQADVDQIRSGNLIVRSHPSRPGALVVDAIITNLATFPQPYPQLQLQFSDLNGAPVAGRRFLPVEYLAGELSGASLMPVQQPVHIALELVDPGPQAVNYALTVVSPEPTP
jgi:predicted Zn finger-like uncharacterized protein